MNVQYISDNKGKTTGVFIPIQEWEDLKTRYKGLEEEALDVPDWHKDLVRKRLAEYRNNPDIALDFDSAMDDIEKEL
ncbi:MAG: addiction module protein [Bacteroidota bacterium]